MTRAFVGIDIISILFGVLLATSVGERYGDELSPNILVLVLGFFLIRSFLFWLLFRSIVKRDLDWIRNILQAIFLMVSLSLLTFALVVLPTYIPGVSEEAKGIALFFTNVQGVIFYYLIVPILMLILSFSIHKLYKLEPW